MRGIAAAAACVLAGAQAWAQTEIIDGAADAGTGPDMVLVSGGYDASSLYLAVEFDTMTFDAMADGFLIGLDADSNPMTGVAEPAFFPIGGEFSVYYNSAFSTSIVRVYDAVATVVIATAPVSFIGDRAEVVVPLATLGGDDGVMGFGAVSGVPLDAEFIEPFDYAPDFVLGMPLVDQTSPIAEHCPADLAEPFGQLDFSDVVAFLTAFAAMDPAADLAAPAGQWDFSDVVAFLGAFGAGCP